jgi:hypothetical protein
MRFLMQEALDLIAYAKTQTAKPVLPTHGIENQIPAE